MGRIMKTIETAAYVSDHREVIQKYINNLCDMITYRLGDNDDLSQLKRELRKRAIDHDMDKLRSSRVLELYADRYEYSSEEEKKEYKAYHKHSNRHHPEYFVEEGKDMTILDFLEFSADIYSSTVIRGKKAMDELDEEMETANFSDELYNAILSTYSKMNYNFKRDANSKNINTTKDLVDIVRENILLKKKIVFMNSGKFNKDRKRG